MPRFSPVIAVVGSPTVAPTFSPGQLAGLRALGFDTLQLNVAWLSRPHDEPLNLRDVVTAAGEEETPRVAQRRAELIRRCAAAKQAGFRTLFHIGSPFMWREPGTGQIRTPGGFGDTYYTDLEGPASARFDITDPRVAEYEIALVSELRRSCPDIDDLLVYTYDQDAWQTSEFGLSPLSRGIPLHERLPGYLDRITSAWTEGRAGPMVWWEPWELSAGQVLACIPHLPAQAFGLCLHSNIAEVQLARPVDTWLRNAARAAARRGIPVVVEAFLSSANEEIEPCVLPTPRLVDEQLTAIAGVTGVTGLKEYFGLDTDTIDVNLDLTAARLADWTVPRDAVVAEILARHGLPSAVAAALDHLDDAVQVLPWDATWFLRKLGTGTPEHGWQAAIVRGRVCTTPSWESSRRAHFMKTDDDPPHSYLLEDLCLRFELAADSFAAAVAELDRLAQDMTAGPGRDYLLRISASATMLRGVVYGFMLHLRETLVARLLRDDRAAGRPRAGHLVDELLTLLRADVENTSGKPEAVAAEELATTDLDAFLDSYLTDSPGLPQALGLHAVTTA